MTHVAKVTQAEEIQRATEAQLKELKDVYEPTDEHFRRIWAPLFKEFAYSLGSAMFYSWKLEQLDTTSEEGRKVYVDLYEKALGQASYLGKLLQVKP